MGQNCGLEPSEEGYRPRSGKVVWIPKVVQVRYLLHTQKLVLITPRVHCF